MLHRKSDRRQARAVYARDGRKHDTRRALLDAALDLLEGGRSFDALSLRELTREVGIVPAAFYRHFRDVEELGLALVDESMTTLRRMIREAREVPDPQRIIRNSVDTLVSAVRANPRHFRVISREMHGGMPTLRERIRREIASFTNELALDFGRLPLLNRWSAEDLQMIAGLMVTAMVQIAEAVLEVPAGDPDAQARVVRMAEKQLRLIALGVPQWQSAPTSARAPSPSP